MKPRVALLVVSDGRGLKCGAVESFHANARRFELATIIEVADDAHTLGFCGAIREGWARLRALVGEVDFGYVFHLEEDFTFNQSFDLGAMCNLLDAHPDLAQVALRRGPHGPIEEAAGGFVEMWPDSYTERVTYEGREQKPRAYLHHRVNFTTNPSVYRRSLIEGFEWPEAPRCEEAFSATLIAEGYSFAYWGARSDAPWVTHAGPRIGHGY